MSIISQEGERISPSLLDIRVLIALADRPRNIYQIARQAEDDGDEDLVISNGTIRPAIKRLALVGLIESSDSSGYFQLTEFGHSALMHEVYQLNRLSRLAIGRLQINRHQ